MVPVLAALLLGQVASPAGAILSFDPEGARRVFPGLQVTALTDPGTRAWVRKAVGEAVSRYPEAALAGWLERVVVVDHLDYEGRFMSGTNDGRRRIVLATGAWGIDAAWVTRSLHHELAHVLKARRGRDFPDRAWRAANAPGFRYGAGGFEAVVRGRTQMAYDDADAERGVLSEYAASALDEDWATVATAVVTEEPAFWALARRFPRLGTKARLAVEFYRRAFPGIRLRAAGATEW